ASPAVGGDDPDDPLGADTERDATHDVERQVGADVHPGRADTERTEPDHRAEPRCELRSDRGRHRDRHGGVPRWVAEPGLLAAEHPGTGELGRWSTAPDERLDRLRTEPREGSDHSEPTAQSSPSTQRD